jgi:hypothetical protein
MHYSRSGYTSRAAPGWYPPDSALSILASITESRSRYPSGDLASPKIGIGTTRAQNPTDGTRAKALYRSRLMGSTSGVVLDSKYIV